MTDEITIIDQQYKYINELIELLKQQKEITLLSEVESNFKKTLLLSIASYFETEISNIITQSANRHTNNNELLVSFIKRKAISRQYHTYFAWDSRNANAFFALFGDSFKDKMIMQVRANEKLDKSIKAFLEIGNERNIMVHENFAEVPIDKTAEEIYKLYKEALIFIDTIRIELIN